MRKLLHQGIGLLELMLSIVIITAIILAATKYYTTAREAARITQAQEMINNVAEAGYKYVEGMGDFSVIDSIAVLIDKGLLPSSYKGNINPWGGAIKVVGDATWLMISFSNINSKACAILNSKYGACDAGSTSCADNCLFKFRSP